VLNKFPAISMVLDHNDDGTRNFVRIKSPLGVKLLSGKNYIQRKGDSGLQRKQRCVEMDEETAKFWNTKIAGRLYRSKYRRSPILLPNHWKKEKWCFPVYLFKDYKEMVERQNSYNKKSLFLGRPEARAHADLYANFWKQMKPRLSSKTENRSPTSLRT